MAASGLHFVLVHGGAHSGSCWERLVPELEALPQVAGVLAVDLSGRGRRAGVRPLEEITREHYIADVVADIEGADLRDVVLVGHSLAGISVPWAAARLPERVRHLVLLSTTTPPPGRSVNDVMAEHPLSPLRRGIDFQRMFCNDLGEAEAQWLLTRLCDEPPGPLGEKVDAVSLPEGLASSFVLLERDEALPPDYQREQAATVGVDRIVPFDSGHSAFVSRPRDLAALLVGLV